VSDRAGQASAITALIPIRQGEADPLRAHLRALGRGPESPLAALRRLHLARWVVIDRLPADAPQADVLPAPQLLFTCCVDGDAASFARELPAALGPELEAIWGRCERFPGAVDADGFARWLLAHHIPTSFFVSAYGDATVRDVHNALAAREQALAFALRAQQLPPAERLAAFRSAFPD
jgi:hypothetical protein